MSAGAAAPARFAVALDVVVRRCRRDDLPALEWYGQFTPHRAVFAEAFARQQRGEVVMLVAEMNDFPVGQVWLDLTVRADEDAALLWALRVFPFLRGLGIGSRLMDAAEKEVRRRGLGQVVLGVEKHNQAALRLYRSRGYRVDGPLVETFEYVRPDGGTARETVDQWLLRLPVRADIERKG